MLPGEIGTVAVVHSSCAYIEELNENAGAADDLKVHV
jgi:hypothetical protein